MSKKLG